VGQELKTTLRFDGRILEGVALLEGDSLVFRDTARATTITLKFSEIFKAEANAGWLDLQTGRGLLLFELGPKAEIWAEKIKNPKALVDKLGVDAQKKVAIVGKLDADLRADLDATGAKVAKSARGKDFDVVFVAAATKKDLEKLPSVREMIKDDGGIWIVYPKNAGAKGAKDGSAGPTEREVLTAGRTLSLTDNKVAKVDDVLTAVRFVIPVAQRKKK
jgi:hypothetical protein